MSDCPEKSPVKYEYLDHTADVQIHAWGATLEEAIEQTIVAMYGYMTEDISTVEPAYSMDFSSSGHKIFLIQEKSDCLILSDDMIFLKQGNFIFSLFQDTISHLYCIKPLKNASICFVPSHFLLEEFFECFLWIEKNLRSQGELGANLLI